MANKYAKTPDSILDFHGYTTVEVKRVLDTLVNGRGSKHIRIITGKGNHGPNGAVVRTFVKKYLNDREVRFTQSKLQDGGEGALEVFLGDQ